MQHNLGLTSVSGDLRQMCGSLLNRHTKAPPDPNWIQLELSQGHNRQDQSVSKNWKLDLFIFLWNIQWQKKIYSHNIKNLTVAFWIFLFVKYTKFTAEGESGAMMFLLLSVCACGINPIQDGRHSYTTLANTNMTRTCGYTNWTFCQIRLRKSKKHATKQGEEQTQKNPPPPTPTHFFRAFQS